MVKITEVAKRIAKNGEEFHILIVESDIKIVKSKNGNFKAELKKASIFPSGFTFDELNSFVGRKIDGDVVKIDCEPYTFKGKSGEVVECSHRWVYQAPEGTTIGQQLNLLQKQMER